MLRKNFMKRLSKSASDLSGCKKKTHSTSPEEEEKDVVPFSTPTNTASDDERDSQGGQHTRPSSAASTRSVPEFPASSSSAKVKKPLTGTLSRKARKLFKANKQQQQQPSEVGIRSVGGQIHSAYRGHQVSVTKICYETGLDIILLKRWNCQIKLVSCHFDILSQVDQHVQFFSQ